MAKSLRSKWKRKMRAIKRERYGKKELEKLKMIVKSSTSSDISSNYSTSLVNVVTKSEMTRKIEPMEIDNNQNHTTTREVQNSFPVWLGSHKKKKIIRVNRKINKQKKKLQRKEFLRFKR